jgi:hypothetical protein
LRLLKRWRSFVTASKGGSRFTVMGRWDWALCTGCGDTERCKRSQGG